MTDAEISRRLALAIGWTGDQNDPDVVIYHGRTCSNTAEDWCAVWYNDHWREFDYRDPAVIWPIAERYNCFPTLDMYNRWIAGKYPYVTADTAAKAVALAVIKAHNIGEKK